MNIFFMRHGETEDNVISKLSTSAPGPSLTEKGRKQATMAFQHLPKTIDLIISSPLIRAIETSDILNDKYNCEFTADDRIRELSVGTLEGRNDQAVFDHLDIVWREWSLKNNLHVPAGPNGESAAEVLNRCKSFIKDILGQHKDINLLVVAHSGVLQLLLGHLCKNLAPIWCYENWLRNCQVVHTEVKVAKLLCLKWGDIDLPEKEHEL